jgi:hypothetical protein
MSKKVGLLPSAADHARTASGRAHSGPPTVTRSTPRKFPNDLSAQLYQAGCASFSIPLRVNPFCRTTKRSFNRFVGFTKPAVADIAKDMAKAELLLSDDWRELQLTPALILRAVRRGPMVAVGVVTLAFFFGLLGANVLKTGLGSQSFFVTLGAPPEVEPLILENISQAEAKTLNDATPFADTPVVPAPPFLFAGSALDLEKASDCLAATIFYEAGNETVQGQMAVVQVVLNRVRHPAYPKTVCGVVFQGHERRTGCQFSYTCDGSMARRPNDAAWTRFRNLSRAMLNGLVYAPVGLATHYHTDWVRPKWSARLDKVRAEGTHLFFRYADDWGKPRAFRTKPVLAEPAFGKMALLSMAHRAPEFDLDAVMAEIKAGSPQLPDQALLPPTATGSDPFLANPAPTPANVSAVLTPEDKSKDTFLIHVDPLLDAAALSVMAERACGTRRYCKVLAWADPDLMPKGLPIEPRARASMAYSYVRQSVGSGQSRWNCELYPQDKANLCLPDSAGGARLTPENARQAPSG